MSRIRKLFLVTVIIIGVSGFGLPPSPLMAQSAKPLTMGLFHFPPFLMDPHLSDDGRPGIGIELYERAAREVGVYTRFEYLPPSRLLTYAGEGKLDLVCIGRFLVPKVAPFMHCSGNLVTATVVLYRNLLLEPKDPLVSAQGLNGKTILVPKESKVLFQTLVAENIELLEIAQPRLMAKMFAAQRSGFMMDFSARAETYLAREHLSFDIRRAPLVKVTTHLCIKKSLPKATQTLDTLHEAFRALQHQPIARQLEKKYEFAVDWD
jgi:hypothetical protein